MPTLHHSLDEPAPTETEDLPNPETPEDVIDLVAIRLTVRAKLRDELSFSSFRHGGFTEGADADLTDAELRAAGRHRSARQLPTDAKRTRKQLVSVATKRRAERTKVAHLSE